MIATSHVAAVVVLALFSVLWVRITRRDWETARNRALSIHLDWAPAPATKQKNRRAL